MYLNLPQAYLAYSSRHMSRCEGLVQRSFLVDVILRATSDLNVGIAELAAEESRKGRGGALTKDFFNTRLSCGVLGNLKDLQIHDILGGELP